MNARRCAESHGLDDQRLPALISNGPIARIGQGRDRPDAGKNSIRARILPKPAGERDDNGEGAAGKAGTARIPGVELAGRPYRGLRRGAERRVIRERAPAAGRLRRIGSARISGYAQDGQDQCRKHGRVLYAATDRFHNRIALMLVPSPERMYIEVASHG